MPLGPGFTVENRACVALYDLPARTPPGASPPPSSTASSMSFAPTRPDGEKSQCTYRCVVLPDPTASSPTRRPTCLNAPTGAWCSLTATVIPTVSGCLSVSMHLQVRGAP